MRIITGDYRGRRLETPAGYEAVSYTHLDVYKRQGQVSGNTVSHSNRHTRRKWNANIQTVRINDNGTVRRANVCTRCIRSNKINRAI